MKSPTIPLILNVAGSVLFVAGIVQLRTVVIQMRQYAYQIGTLNNIIAGASVMRWLFAAALLLCVVSAALALRTRAITRWVCFLLAVPVVPLLVLLIISHDICGQPLGE